MDGWIRPSTPIEKTRVVTRRYHIVKEETPIQKLSGFPSSSVPRSTPGSDERDLDLDLDLDLADRWFFGFPSIDPSVISTLLFSTRRSSRVESSRVECIEFAPTFAASLAASHRSTSVRRDFAQKKGLEYRQSRYATHARRYTHAREGKGTIRRRRRQWLDAMRDLHSWCLMRFGRRAVNE